ncbi:hypothetical protein GFM07_41175 [Rhizobium leguminosarum bv. viciae]|nr:hypothetical protein [Rhizobium leguminosarum bv. viciae]NKL60271.1 hypothetical protein [Rhizobium leguminosarum bv. viciae]
MRRQFTTYQFDLFSSAHSGKTPAMPQWQTLSEGTPQALTAPIVRLLVDPRQRRERLPVETGAKATGSGRLAHCNISCRSSPPSETSSSHPRPTAPRHKFEPIDARQWPRGKP